MSKIVLKWLKVQRESAPCTTPGNFLFSYTPYSLLVSFKIEFSVSRLRSIRTGFLAVQRRSLNYLYYPYFKQYTAADLRNCLNRSLEVRHLMSSLSFFMDNHQPRNLRSKFMYFKSVHKALRLSVGSPLHGSAD